MANLIYKAAPPGKTYPDEQRTPWFPGSISPINYGLYELRYVGQGEIVNAHFDGNRWLLIGGSSTSLLKYPLTQIEWRGLNTDPSPRGFRVVYTKGCMEWIF